MSVLIRGMEMPENCFECPCCRHDSIDGIKAEQCNLTLDVFGVNNTERWIGRGQNCPLVEIKEPHGRLIDATFEESHYASMLLDPTPDVTEQDKHNARIIIEALRMAGTVIEAEGSEE